jgi:AmmeMemoRadiSam system protein B/AmmeMemoRadiSam system protein A
MKRSHIFILFLLLVLIASAPLQSQTRPLAAIDEPLESLPPSVAGAFYPADAETLKAGLKRYLESANPPAIEGEIVAVIVPHAGYIYSGPIAAYAYKVIAEQLRMRGDEPGSKPDAVVVLAFSHRGGFNDVSVYYKGSVETPLGQIRVNEKVAREFMESDKRLSFSQRVFMGEHSVEVQMPFIKRVLPDVPVVPVIFGRQGAANIDAVSRALEKIAKKYRIIVVATSDLSHYKPYKKANALDAETVDLILKGDPRKMARYAGERSDRMCGPAPVLAALSFAESQNAEPVLLKYANSGDTAGSKDAVVGYTSIAFVKNAGLRSEASGPKSAPEDKEGDEDYLSEDDKKTLLRLARGSVESIVRERRPLEVDPPESARLRDDGAAFVTLRIDGRLRGCIGRIEAKTPLYQIVVDMAAEAATEDHRFRPVRPDELAEIHIEISVNTPLRPVGGAEDIELGKHGVVVAEGLRRGVFLPQVATESGWTKEEFLRNLCSQKAGLAPDAYENGARLFVFTSIVFEEEG